VIVGDDVAICRDDDARAHSEALRCLILRSLLRRVRASARSPALFLLFEGIGFIALLPFSFTFRQAKPATEKGLHLRWDLVHARTATAKALHALRLA
jgi:hypothetical protein